MLLNPSSDPSSQPGPKTAEIVTDIRYSLAYEPIGSKDIMVVHPAGNARLVSYPTPSAEQLQLRDSLLAKGVIAGELLNDIGEAEQVFRVPRSTRPIGYDSSAHAEGAFSYDDEQLFHDLGSLLATLVRVNERSHVVRGDIGHSVVLVDFTRPGERQLYLTPGVETILEPLAEGVDPLEYYMAELPRTLGQNFDVASSFFRMGFNETLNNQENN